MTDVRSADVLDASAHELTAEQREIVDARLDGTHVVDAGAGTGKTYTIVRRALRLVADGELAPEQILIVTFMKKAAVEVADRLAKAFAARDIPGVPACSTIHALAASLVREFAYATGISPDVRAIDDFRARSVFRRAYDDLLAGNLGVDLSDLPILERGDVLQRSLATLALDLKNRAIPVDDFERDAIAAAAGLERLPFGQLYAIGKRGGRTNLDPKRERTPEERRDEGRREARNVVAVAALLRRFDARLEAEALLTYGDLLVRATAMLRARPWIAARLRERWRHAMIDEFQDSNPQQLAFLKAIFGDALDRVVVVGDVRQAIFEWNGADPGLMRSIAGEPGVLTLPLTRNRRSPQQILDAAHHVLGAAAGDPLVAQAGHASEIVLRKGHFGEGDTTAENRLAEADAIAREIASLRADGTPCVEIAILLRSRTHARIYARALAERGIPSRTHGGVGFYDVAEICDAVAWLKLLHDPSDGFALARVLESPVVGLSRGSIVRLHREAPRGSGAAYPVLLAPLPAWLGAAERERLERLRGIVASLAEIGALATGDAVLRTIDATGLELARCEFDPAMAPQIRANLAKLVALATGFSAERPLARLRDFLLELEERDRLEVGDSEGELGGDEVTISTIHGAKGLEWDHVFVANVAPKVFPNESGRNDTVARRDPHSRALALRYDCDGRKPLRWVLLEPHDPATGERTVKLPKDEELRLFYVALTRAKRAIYVSAPTPRGLASEYFKKFEVFCATCESGPFRTADETAREPQQLPFAFGAPSGPDDEALVRLAARLTRAPDRPAPRPLALSFTAIATYRQCPRQARFRYVLGVPDFRDGSPARNRNRDVDAGDEPNDASSTKLDAATYGTIVHAALEQLALAAIAGTPLAPDDAVAQTLEEFGCDDGETAARTRRAVAGARAALAPYRPLEAEATFATEIAGVAVRGAIDLVAADASGAVTIFDYKTGSSPDASYALQLALYRVALAERFPNAATAIVRIGDESSTIVRPPLPSDEEVAAAVRDAAEMPGDEPHPGPACGSCPYAGTLCLAGATYLASQRPTGHTT